MTKVNSFNDLNINRHLKYLIYCRYYLNYSHTTYLDINEPDLRWAKSVEDVVLSSFLLTQTSLAPTMGMHLTTRGLFLHGRRHVVFAVMDGKI